MGDAKASPHEGERVGAGAPRSPDPGAGGLDGRAPDAGKQAGGYAELRAIWARPWIENEAANRRAYAVACRKADPSDIADAARAWVEAADDPRYLPPLANWLDGCGWEKAPPQRRARQSRRQQLRGDGGGVVAAFMQFAGGLQ
jgi:hypothetical protein